MIGFGGVAFIANLRRDAGGYRLAAGRGCGRRRGTLDPSTRVGLATKLVRQRPSHSIDDEPASTWKTMCLRKDTRRARLTLRRIRRAAGALVWRKRASAVWQGAADGADYVAAALPFRLRFQPSHTAPS